MDPEAAQQLLDPAIHLMMDAVHRFEGTVNQVLGDGIMALFGAPITHEDHAARACYAALDILVVMSSPHDFVTRNAMLARRLRASVALDLLVYTPEEMVQMRHRPFMRHVLQTGKVLYERPALVMRDARVYNQDAARSALALAEAVYTYVHTWFTDTAADTKDSRH